MYTGTLGRILAADLAERGGLVTAARPRGVHRGRPAVRAGRARRLDPRDQPAAEHRRPGPGGDADAAGPRAVPARARPRTYGRLVAIQRAVLDHRLEVLDVAEDLDAAGRELLAMVGRGWDPVAHASASTVHISVVDEHGMACATTASAGYGSGATIPGHRHPAEQLPRRARAQPARCACAARPARAWPPTWRRRWAGTATARCWPSAVRAPTGSRPRWPRRSAASPSAAWTCRRPSTRRGCTCAARSVRHRPGRRPTVRVEYEADLDLPDVGLPTLRAPRPLHVLRRRRGGRPAPGGGLSRGGRPATGRGRGRQRVIPAQPWQDRPVVPGFDDVTDEQLRERADLNWAVAPPGVLPAWVAETDYAACPVVTGRRRRRRAGRSLRLSVPAGDGRLRDATVAFAGRRFGWAVDPGLVLPTGDVMAGVMLALRDAVRGRTGRGPDAGLPAVPRCRPAVRPRAGDAAARPGRSRAPSSTWTASTRRSAAARGPCCSATRTTHGAAPGRPPS